MVMVMEMVICMKHGAWYDLPQTASTIIMIIIQRNNYHVQEESTRYKEHERSSGSIHYVTRATVSSSAGWGTGEGE